MHENIFKINTNFALTLSSILDHNAFWIALNIKDTHIFIFI